MLHGTKLSLNDSPKYLNEIEDMKWVPYVSFVGGLKYTMVSMRQNIAQVVGVLSKLMENSSKPHWDATKSLEVFVGYIIVCIVLSR